MLTSILYNDEIAPTYYRMGLSWNTPLPVQPGQFIMLRVSEGIDPFLCRPFGIYRLLRGEEGGGEALGFEILYKVVGKGTLIMSRLKRGERVDLFGPLGRGFPALTGGQKLLMIAGGVGIVPFYMVAEALLASGGEGKLLFGGRCADDLPGLADLKELGLDMAVATDDGTAGVKGVVTALMEGEVLDDTTIYACGPKGMLKEVARIAAELEVPCFVSLDRRMACGMGACLGCAVKVGGKERTQVAGGDRVVENEEIRTTPSPYRMVCKDGPVFDARELDWEVL
ncbi:MAG: dihydroorotate dehydrogenase electron transfer subunit [Thermodesulfobacteriota bacterium]